MRLYKTVKASQKEPIQSVSGQKRCWVSTHAGSGRCCRFSEARRSTKLYIESSCILVPRAISGEASRSCRAVSGIKRLAENSIRT